LITAFRLFSVTIMAISLPAFTAQATSIAAPQGQGLEQAWVTGRVSVRSGPGTDYRVVNRLKRGDFVNVGQCRRGWCAVDVYGGNGYIPERVIGDGANPYHSNGPARPGYIPPQQPGTLVPID
jgi:uncharacterized protein YraI